MKIFMILINCFFLTFSYSQNTALILGNVYFQNNVLSPLPVSTSPTNIDPNDPLDGYDGAPAKSAQNIQVDADGNIIFFIIDNVVFDRNGEVIDVMNAHSTLYHTNYSTGVLGEHSIVPDPGDCNSYYIFSSAASTSISGSYPFYYKLKVYIDASGNLMPGSGFESFDPSMPCIAKWKFLKDVIGTDYSLLSGVPQVQDPMYGIVPNASGYFFFIKNGTRLFRLSIDNLGLHYESFLDLMTIYSDITIGSWGTVTNPQELEVIPLSGGGYRVAFAGAMTFQTSVNYPAGSYEGVLVADLDMNGDLITNTQKYVRYEIIADPTEPFLLSIRGVELSPDGDRLYVSHTQYGVHTSSFDMFDLTVADPNSAMTVISSNTEYSYSQIEATLGERILIANDAGIASVSNANNPTLAVDFDVNYIDLGSYPLATGEFGTQGEFVRLLQDQIDGYDYSTIEYLEYGADIYTVTGTEVWNPNVGGGSNPIISGPGNIAYIRTEIRIKPGASLTINDLEIRFSPGARVVIENSTGLASGASLYMNNSKFTNESRCTQDKLWVGVEVWGNQSQLQNGKQGSLVMSNSSVDNAWVGVLVGARPVTYIPSSTWPGDCNFSPLQPDSVQVVELYSYNNSRNGGLIIATNSTFYNNQVGVYFRPYFSPGGLDNLSVFNKSEFIWDGALKENAAFKELAKLEEVKGIRFKGCLFENTMPGAFPSLSLGFGIYATESQFYVFPKCDATIPVGTPCPSETIGKFEGLFCGILAQNANSFSFSCKGTDFLNNQYGIVALGTDKEIIVNNEFQIRQANSYQTVGVYLGFSTGFTVEDNNFKDFVDPSLPGGPYYSYGTVVNNSGANNDFVYNNDYSNLRIGGQSENVCATLIDVNNQVNESGFKMKGLVWKCNDFKSNIDLHDLSVMDGRINYHQGYATGGPTQLDRIRAAANNKFSLDGESLIEHDVFLSNSSQTLDYSYLVLPRHIPDSYDNVKMSITPVVYTPAITSDINACPSNFNGDLVISKPLKQMLITISDSIIVKEQPLIEGGDEVLLNAIIENTPDETKNALLLKSPYLSDEVLLAYVTSNPPSGYLKEIIVSNSPVSEVVITALQNVSMPNGIANQIDNVQVGQSARTKLVFEINSLKGEKDLLNNKIISQKLLNKDGTGDMSTLIDYLKEDITNVENIKTLYHIYLSMKDYFHADEVKQTLVDLEVSNEFIQLAEIQKVLAQSTSSCLLIEEDSIIRSELLALQNNTLNKRVGKKAECLLNIHDAPTLPLFLVSLNAMQINDLNDDGQSNSLRRNYSVSIYPNPSTGLVTFDFPSNESGELTIEVYDLTGKRMHSESWSDTNGQQIDLSDLHKGMYLVKISIDKVLITTQSLKLQ